MNDTQIHNYLPEAEQLNRSTTERVSQICFATQLSLPVNFPVPIQVRFFLQHFTENVLHCTLGVLIKIKFTGSSATDDVLMIHLCANDHIPPDKTARSFTSSGEPLLVFRLSIDCCNWYNCCSSSYWLFLRSTNFSSNSSFSTANSAFLSIASDNLKTSLNLDMILTLIFQLYHTPLNCIKFKKIQDITCVDKEKLSSWSCSMCWLSFLTWRSCAACSCCCTVDGSSEPVSDEDIESFGTTPVSTDSSIVGIYSTAKRIITDYIRSTREGNVFSRVCPSVYGGGGGCPLGTMNCCPTPSSKLWTVDLPLSHPPHLKTKTVDPPLPSGQVGMWPIPPFPILPPPKLGGWPALPLPLEWPGKRE